jgi:hypothetical protein
MGFCSCGWVQLFYFFLVFKKNKCAARVLAYKNHDKKVEGNSAKQPAFGAACRAFAWAVFHWQISNIITLANYPNG